VGKGGGGNERIEKPIFYEKIESTGLFQPDTIKYSICEKIVMFYLEDGGSWFLRNTRV
jgi:hypothetical protein